MQRPKSIEVYVIEVKSIARVDPGSIQRIKAGGPSTVG